MKKFKQEPWITVGILTADKIDFELYGDFHSFGFRQIFSGPFSAEIINDRIICRSKSDKMEISDEIIFEPTDPIAESFLIKEVPIGKEFHWERKEKQRFIYQLKLLKHGQKIIALNFLPLENYLVSVISSEMSAKSSLQLLKAHAIVSRSWLLRQLENNALKKSEGESVPAQFEDKNESEKIVWYDKQEHELYDVCSDDHCQRFHGVTKITTEIARQAIEQTMGQVLTDSGSICDARYSKSCGGITEEFENVWQPVHHNYLKSVLDYKFEPDNFNLDFTDEVNSRKWIKGNPPAFCNTLDNRILSQVMQDYDRETKNFYRWKVEYSQQELADLIKQKTGIDFGSIIDLQPVERGKSARLVKLRIVGSKKTFVIGKELEIRKVLSKTHLLSSAIVIEREEFKDSVPMRFKIWGAGWGHGVGLCQIGAAVMAYRGFMFDEILMHYFSNARITKIY